MGRNRTRVVDRNGSAGFNPIKQQKCVVATGQIRIINHFNVQVGCGGAVFVNHREVTQNTLDVDAAEQQVHFFNGVVESECTHGSSCFSFRETELIAERAHARAAEHSPIRLPIGRKFADGSSSRHHGHGITFIDVQNAVVVIVDVVNFVDPIVIRVTVAEFEIDRRPINIRQIVRQRRSIGEVEVGGCINRINPITNGNVQILIKDIESIGGIGSFKVIVQAIAIGVFKRRIGRWLTIAAFGNIQQSIVVAVSIQHIDGSVTIGINPCQAFMAHALKRIVQTVAIGIHARSNNEVIRRLSFNIVGDAVVIAVNVQVVQYTVAI